MNLIETQAPQDWHISKYDVTSRNYLIPYINIKTNPYNLKQSNSSSFTYEFTVLCY